MSIELQGVSKRYRRTCAAERIDLTLGPGGICGLLGPSGAGKTTLLNLIAGRVFPDQGTILIDGDPAYRRDRAQGKICFAGEQGGDPGWMTARDVFFWASRFYPGFDQAGAGRLSDRFGLDTKKRLDTLSTGSRSVVKIILALASGTPYVLLDEPVLGLDTARREQFYQELREETVRQPERTFVLATHLVEEIAEIAGRVVLLSGGRIQGDGTPEEMQAAGQRLRELVAGLAGEEERP